ncbi:hypothetical protein EVAR_94035_1 [Eumeta japonica]|uniref:Uncharacterized protein n=1 Tax=Eumeta variegata TaxID=151549 RepID=A0A4C1V7N1_EUMVA|nr:hypothetical protein EVAR_94035_1 [Eumeta japonica]
MAAHTKDSAKRCEHDPLLRVCGGDGRPPSVVTASPKRSVFDRWPEIMSACWMTVVLLCICFLTLYVLGAVLTKRQGLVVQYVKEREPRHQLGDCNKNVYYHYVVERGMTVDFIRFSSYLAKMAMLYRNLRFNVIFLTADPVRKISLRPKPSRFTQLLAPTLVSSSNPKMDEENAQELRTFLAVHRNVNVTIVPIGKHMASTPLKDKWRGSPSTWIAFYARVASVWRYGGIGVDLATANAEYLTQSRPDARKMAVFTEHNDGNYDHFHVDTARDMFQRVQNEDLPILLYLFKFMFELFDQSIPLFDTNNSIAIIDKNDYEKKNVVSKTPVNKASIESGVKISDKKRESNDTIIKHVYKTRSNHSDTPLLVKSSMNVGLGVEDVKNSTPGATVDEAKEISTLGVSKRQNRPRFVPGGDYEMLPPIYLYRFSLSSNEAGDSHGSKTNQRCHARDYRYTEINKRKVDHRKCALTLDLNGNFVSSLSRLHPLLGHIIYANYRPTSPRFAIEDALMAHCSTSDSYNNYCKYISLM